ncbi:MAG TPA: hypothetical protein VFR99_07150 [Marmoricola sp.]|nr:hypothetical protein [Marmoricola sp.]
MAAAARPARRWPGLRPRPYDECLRCGKATQWGHSVCRDCNPAGLPEPSPAQYHATTFLAVIATLVVLTVVAVLLS